MGIASKKRGVCWMNGLFGGGVVRQLGGGGKKFVGVHQEMFWVGSTGVCLVGVCLIGVSVTMCFLFFCGVWDVSLWVLGLGGFCGLFCGGWVGLFRVFLSRFR